MSPRYKLLACEVLKKEVEHLLGVTGAGELFDVEWFEMGLHEKPERLNAALKESVAACAGKGYRAVLLLFGLCSRATADLEAPSDSILVIPRVHDCVSIFLGSARRYLDEHAAEAGTYWFSRGFLHRPDGAEPEFSGLGAGVEMTGPDGKRASVAAIRASFVEQYGEENAEYLMETLVESWKKNYTRAMHLEWEANPDLDEDRRYVMQYASENEWRYESRPVDLRLIDMLLQGTWPEDEFVVVQPGQRLAATNADDALRADAIHNA